MRKRKDSEHKKRQNKRLKAIVYLTFQTTLLDPDKSLFLC